MKTKYKAIISCLLCGGIYTLSQLVFMMPLAQIERSNGEFHINRFTSQFKTCDQMNYFLLHPNEFVNNTKENQEDNSGYAYMFIYDPVQENFNNQCIKPLFNNHMPSNLEYVQYFDSLNCTQLNNWISKEYPNFSDAMYQYRDRCER